MSMLHCLTDGLLDISIAPEQIPDCVVLRDRGETGATEGNMAVKRTTLNACKHVCAYHINLKLQLKLLGRGKHRAIPDGVEDNVGDRILGAIAISTPEEAAVVTLAQAILRQLGKCLQVVPWILPRSKSFRVSVYPNVN